MSTYCSNSHGQALQYIILKIWWLKQVIIPSHSPNAGNKLALILIQNGWFLTRMEVGIGAQRIFSVYLCQKKIEQFMGVKYLRERKTISDKGAKLHGINWPQMDLRYRWRRAVLQQGLEKERVLTGLKTEPGTNGSAAESPENRWHLD